MKTGKTLVELATEIQAQNEAKRDFIADTRSMSAVQIGDSIDLALPDRASFKITPHAHRQIAQRLAIPQKYYDRMHSENAGLLIANINSWFQTKPERRMIRTMSKLGQHGSARAFLSDRYRPIDNFEVSEAILPILADFPDMRIESCELTETRMYLKAIFPRIQTEVARGDVVQAGIVISNSEIGLGAVKVEPLIYRLVCTNGMIAADHAVRKYHVGRNTDGAEGAAAFEVYRDETLQADDRALMLKLQDVVKAAADQARFESIVAKMRETTTQQITGNPVAAVEVLATRFTLNEVEKGSVLNHLIRGGDLSRFGMLNAVTRAAQDVPDYDRATEFERFGGEVLELPANDWRVIAEATKVAA